MFYALLFPVLVLFLSLPWDQSTVFCAAVNEGIFPTPQSLCQAHVNSLFQALGQCGRSKKPADNVQGLGETSLSSSLSPARQARRPPAFSIGSLLTDTESGEHMSA